MNFPHFRFLATSSSRCFRLIIWSFWSCRISQNSWPTGAYGTLCSINEYGAIRAFVGALQPAAWQGLWGQASCFTVSIINFRIVVCWRHKQCCYCCSGAPSNDRNQYRASSYPKWPGWSAQQTRSPPIPIHIPLRTPTRIPIHTWPIHKPERIRLGIAA
jgi:hypothetical protein